VIYQTTKGLDPALAKTGCYFLSVIYVVEEIMKKAFTVGEVNTIFKLAKKVHYVGEDAYMKHKAAQGIAQIASGFKKEDVYMKRVQRDDRHNYTIGHYRRRSKSSGAFHHHFVVMGGLAKVEFDPWSAEGSRTVREGDLMDHRYFFVEEV